MQSAGLGTLRPVETDQDNLRMPQGAPRLPEAVVRELNARDALTVIVGDDDDATAIADQLDDDGSDDRRPSFLRGEFDANLAEHVSADAMQRIANDLLDGITADLNSRKDWEALAEKAIELLGLMFEEPSGEVSASGSVSKVWHTLMLEAAIQFWANANAEFLPADGPVKVRDDKPSQIGHNGGPPLDPIPRDELAEDFEQDFNHYLTTVDRQYYRDFSRMLMALGPIGTQFRKVYYNPLRRMPVSEWVKADNLIVSNDAVHLQTAGRVTERIMMRHADVKRLQYIGWWLDQPLVDPVDTPTGMDRVVGSVEGIKPGPELQADHRHEIYECYTDLDLPGFEHEEDGKPTGLPLPYRVTLDKDSRRVLEIRRNWREGDDNFDARQRYVMFGLLPGFGFYCLGFVHVLGNTERALTALEREIIDAGMFSIFPGFAYARGSIKGGSTVFRIPPGGGIEVDLQMKQGIRDVLQELPYKDLSPTVMALAEKLEDNGRKLVGAMEIPVGEGTANIPVGTMIAMIEEGTKVTAAVHKGLHQSRTEEFELLKELIAEDPGVLSRFAKSPQRQWEAAEEFSALELVPASDPNTPSHVHRVMRAIALGQLAQMFPGRINQDQVIEAILQVIRQPDPQSFILPQQTGPQPPNPEQIKLQIAQLQAQLKGAELQSKERIAQAQLAGKERDSALDFAAERMKVQADIQGDYTKLHDSTGERAIDLKLQQDQQEHEKQRGLSP